MRTRATLIILSLTAVQGCAGKPLTAEQQAERERAIDERASGRRRAGWRGTR